MALAATTIWETQPGATSGNVNGGGFNPANANMPTDLAATSATGNSPVVTSVTYTFVANDVNNWLYIKSGTNWTPGWYKITAVNAGAATLSAAVGSATQPTPITGIPRLNTVAGCATTGSPTGGTFAIDYSQNAFESFSRTNFSCTTSSTTLSTATAGTFTAVMVGNIIHITTTGTGAHFVIGYYEVVSVTSGTAVVLDRTPQDGNVTSATNGTARLGGAISLGSSTANLTDQLFFQQMTSGMIVCLGATGSGSYSLQTVGSLTNATTAPVWLVGYSAIRGDNPNDANARRPIFALATLTLTLPTNWMMQYLSFTGTASTTVQLGSGNRAETCKFVNSSTTAGRTAVASSANSTFVNCEFICYRGLGCNVGGNSGNRFLFCYFRASDILAKLTGSTATVTFTSCIFAGGVTAAVQSTGVSTGNCAIENCTLVGYVTPTGIGVSLATGTLSFTILNSIIYGFATGVSHADTQSVGRDDYNDYFNNTADVSAAGQWQKGPNDLALDPQFSSVVEVANIGTVTTNGAGTTLTDSAQNFTTAGVVAGRDYIYIVSGTGVTAGIYGITTVGTTTLVVDISIGASASNIVYRILTGHNYAIESNLKAEGAPGAFPPLGAAGASSVTSTGYMSMGAVQPNPSGGGAGILAGEGIGLVITS